MNAQQIRTTVLDVLASVAPEIERAKLRGNVSLREQVDLDSVDVMNYVAGLSARFGIEIAEEDYPQLFRLDSCVHYLADRIRRPGTRVAPAEPT